MQALITSRPEALRPSRLVVARLLLAALLAVAAVVIGPGLLRGAFEAGHSTSVPATSSATSATPAPELVPAVIGPGPSSPAPSPAASVSPAASAT